MVQEIYGASPQTFSLLFGLNSVGLILVGQINGKLLVGRVRLDKVLAVGLAVVLVSAVSLLLMATGVFGEVGLTPSPPRCSSSCRRWASCCRTPTRRR